MLKNIQKQLLIKYPLLWNTKIIPLTIILVAINFIFFSIGYQMESLNFNESASSYDYNSDGIIIFFCVFIALLLIILWLVFYLKNNSFKSFYPKTNFSLFKEWYILLFISFLTSLFTVSFYYGKEARLRSYYTENEARKRCEILSKASFFVDGSFSNNYSEEVTTQPEIIADSVDSYNNSIAFNKNRYSFTSLLNKNVNSYTFFKYETDSIHKHTIKTWLVNQQKDSILQLFNNYLKIAKEHNLKANINAQQWLELINDYPKFEDYHLIGKTHEGDFYYPENYTNGSVFDQKNKYVAIVNNEKLEFYKYYVPESYLNYNYDKISDSWNNPDINFESLLISIYFALALSLLLFSFRVTSGKNWLIAVVSLGVLSILFGIISLIIRWDYTFPCLLLFTILFALFYFFRTLFTNKTKKNIGSYS